MRVSVGRNPRMSMGCLGWSFFLLFGAPFISAAFMIYYGAVMIYWLIKGSFLAIGLILRGLVAVAELVEKAREK